MNQTSLVTPTTTNTYQWDAANRLVSITTPTNEYVFGYDGLGRRVQISELIGGTVIIANTFLWCGTELCEERDSSGATIQKRFFGEGEQISGTNYYFTRDHLGSVREMTDNSGTVQAEYNYDPYGQVTQIAGSMTADFLYAGYYYHSPSGLYLTLYRAYDSANGRWLNRDPIGEAGGLNMYDYVVNNPINKTDSTGLWFGIDDAIFAGAGAIIGVGARFAVDLATGHQSSWEDYIGSAVGGAAGSETLLYTANPFLAGAAGGAAGNLTTQGLKLLTGKQCEFNTKSLLVDTAIGTATGFIPGARIPGVTAGRGSDIQVFSQILTKAGNGTINDITSSTAARMAQGAFVQYAVPEGAVAGTGASTLYNSYFP